MALGLLIDHAGRNDRISATGFLAIFANEPTRDVVNDIVQAIRERYEMTPLVV